MTITVKKPRCIRCDRGSGTNLASLGGNEPFFLVPSEIILNGIYQGKTWNIFCGECLRKLLGSDVDYSNIIPSHADLEIVINGKEVIIRWSS